MSLLDMTWLLKLALVLTLFSLIVLVKYFTLGALIAECCFALLCGSISTVIVNPRFATELDNSASYLAQVIAEPRVGETGKMELSIKLLAKGEVLNEALLNSDQAIQVGSLAVLPLKRPIKVLCKAQNLSWKNIHLAQYNDLFLFKANFETLTKAELWQPFSYSATLLRRGYEATCKIRFSSHLLRNELNTVQKWREYIRQRSESLLGTGERSGMLLSMAFGYRDVLSKGTEQAFKKLGLAHLLVVSGYQVGLVFATVLLVLNLLVLWPRFRILSLHTDLRPATALLISLIFVLLVGAEQSAMRAGIALTLFVVARWLGRARMDIYSLLSSLIILSAIWPGCIFEPGVHLTYAALVGLSIGGRANSSSESKLLRYMRATTLATFFTSLVSLAWFSSFSAWGFLLNPLVAPILSIISCNLAIFALLLAVIGLDPNGFLLNLVADMLWWVRELVWDVSRVGWGYWEW